MIDQNDDGYLRYLSPDGFEWLIPREDVRSTSREMYDSALSNAVADGFIEVDCYGDSWTADEIQRIVDNPYGELVSNTPLPLWCVYR